MKINKSLISKMTAKIVKEYGPEKIVLFGSYAWGKPTKDSDIDIFIVKDTKKKRVDRFVEVKRILLNPRLGIPVSPLVLTPAELKRMTEQKNHFILQILKEGKVLYGQ